MSGVGVTLVGCLALVATLLTAPPVAADGGVVAAGVVAPETGLTLTSSRVDGTLTYQGQATDNGITVLRFTSLALTLYGTQVVPKCQTLAPPTTGTAITSTPELALQGDTGTAITLLVTQLGASGLAQPFTVLNPPAVGDTLTAVTNLDAQATLLSAPEATGALTTVATLC